MTLTARLTAMLGASTGPVPLDGDDYWADHRMAASVDAAVLIAFIDRPHPTILLTRRQAHLNKHSGQVAFPGGRVDPDDVDARAAALREAEEEVGLLRTLPTIIGATDLYRTGTGYCITPVLAVVPPDAALTANPDEVAHLFEVRVDHLFDPANHHLRSSEWEGRERAYWDIACDGERVWGATAGMIVNLGHRLGLLTNPRALNRVFTA